MIKPDERLKRNTIMASYMLRMKLHGGSYKSDAELILELVTIITAW